jgi:type I restriction enzyme M protein
MIWIAPSEKDTGNAALEKRLWDAADQFRANSGLKDQLFTSTLLKKLLKRVSEIPASLDYDAFGRIYEYFLAPWERVAAPAFSVPVRGSPTGRGEFAMSEGQGGGEPSGASSTTGTVARRVSASDSANQFYIPSSIVRLLTEVIEPYHGRILDPACGSGGMFVQQDGPGWKNRVRPIAVFIR